ncbi:multidrug MFS transporter [Edwardsiella hoshinae]|uniref:Multidrug MFS transporter n=1 Tax=Edwardsiella hoshinae TaxID=93378 RepID=A0ABN4SVX3_9GAMM|nr:MFS transporter [Edwardsiella hoshinae]AOV97118.1 multidrug MFS transporter [Edwardsiella hoshinae]QPR27040.1 MFS transporter [Edwardsiella hoshinae]
MVALNPSNSLDGLPLRQRYSAMLAIALGIAIAVLDGAIANVALPSIAHDLQASPADAIWIVNAYQLAVTVSLLSLAAIGERIGYRRIFLSGCLLFSLTSLTCALSDSLLTLTLSRVLQGFAAAALMSVNTALIRLIYPQSQLGRGMGLNALVVAVSSAAGPTIAAAVLSLGDWPWLFAINIPFGLFAYLVGRHTLPANPATTARAPFDRLSALLNALTFGLLLSLISGVAQRQSPVLLWLEGGGLLICATLLIRRERHQPQPLLPIDLMRIPVFSLSIATSICSFCAQMLALVSLPFFLQRALGYGEVATGLLLTPWPLATMIVAPIAGRLVERVNAGLLGCLGMALTGVGLLTLAWLPAQPDAAAIIWRMALCGAGFGLFQSPNNHTMIAAAPRQRSGGASGMLGTARLFGQTLGAALVALMFNWLGDDRGTHGALLLAAVCALVAAGVSLLRTPGIAQQR